MTNLEINIKAAKMLGLKVVYERIDQTDSAPVVSDGHVSFFNLFCSSVDCLDVVRALGNSYETSICFIDSAWAHGTLDEWVGPFDNYIAAVADAVREVADTELYMSDAEL